LLSGHFKKQILGMEPRQIAHAIQEQAAVLEAIREGVLAINADGRIVTCNREAKKVLGFEGVDLTGREVLSVAPTSRLPEVLISGRPQLDQPMVLGKALVITNRVPVLQGGAVVGAVATFRDKLQLEEIESRLATIGRYADDLRAQRHEFSNVLHLVLGLISMSDYDGAMKVIERVNEEHRRAIGFYLARLRDAAVVGILVGKTHRAVELGIQLTVSEDSCVSDTCPHRDAVITILGNAIENALEALRSAPGKASPPEVRVLVREEPHRLVLDVADNGPGVDRTVREHLFEPGATTKGEGRGLGLAIMAKLVAASGGTISCESDGEGTAIRVELPTERTS
jgi:two-component system CitB family sensor kinase